MLFGINFIIALLIFTVFAVVLLVVFVVLVAVFFAAVLFVVFAVVLAGTLVSACSSFAGTITGCSAYTI